LLHLAQLGLGLEPQRSGLELRQRACQRLTQRLEGAPEAEECHSLHLEQDRLRANQPEEGNCHQTVLGAGHHLQLLVLEAGLHPWLLLERLPWCLSGGRGNIGHRFLAFHSRRAFLVLQLVPLGLAVQVVRVVRLGQVCLVPCWIVHRFRSFPVDPQRRVVPLALDFPCRRCHLFHCFLWGQAVRVGLPVQEDLSDPQAPGFRLAMSHQNLVVPCFRAYQLGQVGRLDQLVPQGTAGMDSTVA